MMENGAVSESNMTGTLVKTVFKNVMDFDLEDIFECGQCFRWRRQPDGSYSGIVEGSFANVSYIAGEDSDGTGDVKIWSNLFASDRERRDRYWRNYFDLDRNYTRIKRILTTEDSVMRKAVRTGGGIRILNQNKWETLISFIISQNNNIPRIQGCIEILCREHGRNIGLLHGEPLYSFPSVDRLSVLNEDDLDVCRLGYRARYISQAARIVAMDGGMVLEDGESMPKAALEEYLLSLPGVGPKVANCVMLFSMKKAEVFPIDVWMRRVMAGLYGMSERNLSGMQDYAKRNFGEYGGIAQQYLFNYVRKLKRDDPTTYARLGLDSPSMEDRDEKRMI
ncbi:MAG: 8-oxoguanine DNA glycosylase [Clostridiales Family XIII bacterium]|jgi:N-glycosylase/DNA lyase|nr:8-oxoguanine DNA glycosylase [Clostridiales Family XIII bacterium]